MTRVKKRSFILATIITPFAFALFVAAFSDLESAFHAASGRYLLLPSDFFPLEVRHFCLVHFLRLLCDLASAISLCILRPLSCRPRRASEPYEQTTVQGARL